jgi:outer membrane protein W
MFITAFSSRESTFFRDCIFDKLPSPFIINPFIKIDYLCSEFLNCKAMKRILTVLITFIVIASADAQFFVGIEGKAGMSNHLSVSTVGDFPSNGFSYSLSANIGVELIKMFSANTGIEYAELKYTGEMRSMKESGFRIPLKIGYYRYFGRLKPFVNAGMFYSIRANVPDLLYYEESSQTQVLRKINLKNYFGYLAQAGIGYRITDRITVSAACEYNRPFNKELKVRQMNTSVTAFYFSGAVVGVTISL